MNYDHEVDPPQPGPGDLSWAKESSGFEARLSALRPCKDRLDRERLMFLAGQASALESRQRASVVRRWAWPASFGAMTAAAAVLLVLAMRPIPESSGAAGTAFPDREGLRAVHLERSPGPSEVLILKAGMHPTRVDQVTALSWKIPDNAIDPGSDGGLSVLSIHSLDDLL